jgi:hypothetical protein
MYFKDQDKWEILLAKTHESQIISAFEFFRKNNIEPILIKGWAAAVNYPPTRKRRFGDTDLAVPPEDFEKGLTLIKQPGMAGHFIDLHNGLRQLDKLSWNSLYANSILKPLQDSLIRVLSEEDHLRLLSVHWLIDGGRFKDKLWDIYYAVENRRPDFDWDRCLNVVSPIRRRWVVCAIGIAHAYLGLNISGLPFENEAGSIPTWIKKCVEKEWKYNYNFEPILTSTHDSRLLVHQILRRLPPNPIRATIEAEGDLYGNRRALYQAKVIANRLGPFSRDLFHFVRLKMRGKV